MFAYKVSPSEKGSKFRYSVVMITVMAIIVMIIVSFTFPSFAGGRRSKVAQLAVPNVSTKPSTGSISFYGQNGAKSYAELFQAIKSMTVEFNFTSNDNGSRSTSSERITYVVGMAATDDGKIVYKVNLTDTGIDYSNKVDMESALVWIDPESSSILQVSAEGKIWTGTDAQEESGVLSMLTTDYWLSLLNSSTVVPMATETGSNYTVSFGSTQLYASTYEGLPSLTEFQNLIIAVGTIPQGGMQLVLSSNYNVPGGGSGSFRVLALELNQ